VGCCEYGNELSGSKNLGEFIEKLSVYLFIMEDGTLIIPNKSG
jgi:hypothetical protein